MRPFRVRRAACDLSDLHFVARAPISAQPQLGNTIVDQFENIRAGYRRGKETADALGEVCAQTVGYLEGRAEQLTARRPPEDTGRIGQVADLPPRDSCPPFATQAAT